jgi:hypothetical protein
LVVDEDDGAEVDDADNSAESAPVLGAAFRSGVEAFLVFFFTAEGAEDGTGGAAAEPALAAGGGVTIAIVADVLCWGICESNRCAAGLVR